MKKKNLRLNLWLLREKLVKIKFPDFQKKKAIKKSRKVMTKYL